MILKNVINKIINRLSWGQFLVSKIQFMFTLVIMLKVFNVKPIVYFIAGLTAFFLTYLMGWFFDKYLKEGYHEQYYGKFKFKN